MLNVGETYSKRDFKREIYDVVYGIQKDILKDKFAYGLPHADFYLYESKDNMWIYGVTYVNSKNIFGGKCIKVLGKISKEEYEKI